MRLRLIAAFTALLLLTQPGWALVCESTCPMQPATPTAGVAHGTGHPMHGVHHHEAPQASMQARASACSRAQDSAPLYRAERVNLATAAEYSAGASLAPQPPVTHSVVPIAAFLPDTSPLTFQVLRI